MNLEPSTSRDTQVRADSAVTIIELVERARTGDLNAFEAIMRRYNQRLYRIARSILHDEHEALDIVQETYIKAYYQLHQFTGPGGFASWLSRIASNEAIMRIRKASRISYTLDESEQMQHELIAPGLQPMDNLAIQQLRKLLEDAVDSLPVEYRSVYVMRAIQQLNTRETATSLDISVDVVKTRYLRAKRALQKIFEGHLEQTGLDLYEFAGKRCDAVVKLVTEQLKQNQLGPDKKYEEQS